MWQACSRRWLGRRARSPPPGKRIRSSLRWLFVTLPALRPADLACALEAWGTAIGTVNVDQDPDTRERLETATYRIARRALGMLRPGSREEVQECLRIANRLRVPLYPVSRGRNWGLGSRAPAM